MFAEYKRIWSEMTPSTGKKPVRLHAVSTRLLFEAVCFAGQVILGRLSQLYVVSRSEQEGRAKATIAEFNRSLYLALIEHLEQPTFKVLTDPETGFPVTATHRLQHYLELATPEEEVIYFTTVLGYALQADADTALTIAAHFASPLAELSGNVLRRVFGPPRGASGANRPRSADYYNVLQVSPDAEPEVIDMAYKALAKKHHPDVGGDVEKMKLINEAYHVLRDPVRRQEYDEEFGQGGNAAEKEAASSKDRAPHRASEETNMDGASRKRMEPESEGGPSPTGVGFVLDARVAFVTLLICSLILLLIVLALSGGRAQ